MTGDASQHGAASVDRRRRLIVARQLPWVTCGILLLQLLLEPQAASMELSRTALADGQLWRLLTGNFVHWSASHRLWDVLMFVAFGLMAERLNRKAYGLCIVAGAMASSVAFLMGSPRLESCRGLSGIDCALAAYVGFTWLLDARTTGAKWAASLLPLMLIGKISAEAMAGRALFAEAEFLNLPLVHLAGAMVGACVVCWPSFRRTLHAHRTRPARPARG